MPSTIVLMADMLCVQQLAWEKLHMEHMEQRQYMEQRQHVEHGMMWLTSWEKMNKSKGSESSVNNSRF